MGKLTARIHSTLIAGILAGIPTSICAKPSKQQPTAPKAKAEAASQAANPTEPAIQPTRYVGEDVSAYVATILPTLAIRSSETDPFGQYQDLDAKAAAAATAKAVRTTSNEPTVPFAEIISLIQINTVMSGEKRFLVGSRSFSEGDQFPLNFRGNPIRIQVVEVSSRQIQFKNLETGESAVHRLNLLPAGMTAGQSGITAPGMAPSGKNAPLEIEPPSQNPAGSPSR